MTEPTPPDPTTQPTTPPSRRPSVGHVSDSGLFSGAATGSDMDRPRVAQTTADRSSTDRDRLKALILQAFEAARQSGKDDWRTMSVAVLKNRLSQLIGEKFDQRQYGYVRILDLVLDFPEILSVDETKQPPSVVLIADSDSRHLDEHVKIRPDLWRAIIDYEKGEPYVLVAGDQAVPVSEAPEGVPRSAPLPTISPEELDRWRRDFVEANRHLVQGSKERPNQLSEWIENRLGTRALPDQLQGRWNLYLKRAVLDKLLDWFEENRLATPADVIVGVARDAKKPDSARKLSEENQLRLALIDCLSKMSYEELRQIRLPATSLLRLRR